MRARGWAVFRHRDFRLFCAARFCLSLATQIQTLAIAWLVYELSDSALALGLVGLTTFLPSVALVLVTGLVADRFDRRWILVVSYGVLMLTSVGLLAYLRGDRLSLWPVYLMAATFGAARAFANPAAQAIVPSLVPPSEFAQAVAWNSSVLQFATVAGPAFGGLLYALGPAAPFQAAAACFGMAAGLVAALRHRGAAAREPVTWTRVIAGLRFIVSKPLLLGAISLDLFAVLLGGATALMPIFARDILEVGPWGLGLLRSMPAVGALLMSLILVQSGLLTRHAGRRMLQAVAVFGLATIGFGCSRSFVSSVLLLAVLGAADMVSVVVRQTLVQSETPDALRGRVAAVNTVFIGASNELGEFESGALAWLVGAPQAVVIGGIGTLLLAFLWGRWFPELRQRDELVAPPAR